MCYRTEKHSGYRVFRLGDVGNLMVNFTMDDFGRVHIPLADVAQNQSCRLCIVAFIRIQNICILSYSRTCPF